MRVEKSWGYEHIIMNDGYCCKLLVYTRPGIASSLHYHERKHETFVVGSGVFEVEKHGEKRVMNAGQAIIMAQGVHHRVRCIEPGFIVEASTHDDPNDCVRLVPSET